MSQDHRKQHHDPDGVRVIETERERRGVRVWLAVAVASIILLTAGLLVLRRTSPSPVVSEGSAPPIQDLEAPVARLSAPEPPAGRAPPVSTPVDRQPAPTAANEPADDAEPSAQEREWLEAWVDDAIAALRASGETEGIAAFPPPGTNPVKTGLVVPDDFELPPGYVRHYQTTDDGQRLDPILMYSPDAPPATADGEPIELTDDGIVPPDMAPPGLPVRMLEVPTAAKRPGIDPHHDAR